MLCFFIESVLCLCEDIFLGLLCITMSLLPQVPAPAHTQADSMLSRHFGKETVNYFSSMELLSRAASGYGSICG